MEQGREDNFKSAYKTQRRLLPLIVKRKSSALQPSSQTCKVFFASDNTYVSFIESENEDYGIT